MNSNTMFLSGVIKADVINIVNKCENKTLADCIDMR